MSCGALPIGSMDDVRETFVNLYLDEEYNVDKTGCKVVEIISCMFIADEPSIFGKVDDDYVQREHEWYLSQSRNIKDFPGQPPTQWLKVADSHGRINSNYGWCVFSPDNFDQFERVVKELQENPQSRRAQIIYNRPSIWVEYNQDGMSDFICTNAVQYFIRNGRLECIVNMRSNDAIWGFRSDYHWQKYVHELLHGRLVMSGMKNLDLGSIVWNAASLHVYERHFHLIDWYNEFGNWNVDMKESKKRFELNQKAELFQ